LITPIITIKQNKKTNKPFKFILLIFVTIVPTGKYQRSTPTEQRDAAMVLTSNSGN